MKTAIGALSGLISYTESKKMTMAKIKCHVSNIAFMNLGAAAFDYAKELAEEADKCRTFAGLGNAIRRIITEVERVIDAAHAEALEMNAQRDENEAFAAKWMAQDSRLIDCLINPSLVEADHAEALEMDADRDQAIAILAENMTLPLWDGCRPMVKASLVNHWHAEALEMNAAIDHMIDEREHVSNCEYEYTHEKLRINEIGRGDVLGFEEKFGRLFTWMRRTALNLYGTGFVTYPPEECEPEYIAACIDCREQWVGLA